MGYLPFYLIIQEGNSVPEVHEFRNLPALKNFAIMNGYGLDQIKLIVYTTYFIFVHPIVQEESGSYPFFDTSFKKEEDR